MLIYQTRGLVIDYFDEITVTQISALNHQYPSPRVLIGVPTHLLLKSERLHGSRELPEMDHEALLYARSVVEPMIYVNETEVKFDMERAKKKFEDYLGRHNLTWVVIISLGPKRSSLM